MKKRISVISIALVFIMLFSFVTASAEGEEGIVLDNNLFYVEMPDGFTADTTITDNYYFEDEDYALVEFYVQGNLQFPDGIKETPSEVIGRRALRIIETDTMGVSVNKVEKVKINGFNAACIYGKYDDIFEGVFKAYVFATKETVYIVYCQGTEKEELSALDAVIVNFTVNGTYFPGDEPTIKHDFSKSEDYYTAFERNSQEYYEDSKETDKMLNVFLIFFFIILLAGPVMIILLIVFINKSRKYKKLSDEYESYFGPIGMVRNQFSAYRMQMPYGSNPYQQQAPYNAQPMGYPQPIQPLQPVQTQEINNQQENNIEQ